jgi:hypothetical protein
LIGGTDWAAAHHRLAIFWRCANVLVNVHADLVLLEAAEGLGPMVPLSCHGASVAAEGEGAS